MAKQSKAKREQPRQLIQLVRNVGNARYGQTFRLNEQQIAEHGFEPSDYRVIEPAPSAADDAAAPTPADDDA